jgi:alpha-tubulin suppressor-like RCC1 family protein
MSDCNNELICWEPNDIITETPISARNYVAWGYNKYGQLGNNNTTNIIIPKKFKFIGIKQISCGLHTAILLTNGLVYTCGLNVYGQLGNGTYNNIPNPKFLKIDPNIGRVKQISCGGLHTAILLTNGLVYTCGYNFYGQLGNGTYNTIPNPKFLKIDPNIGKVKQISCGLFHTAILLNNGLVYTCGNNVYGQLGRLGNGTNDIPNPKFLKIDQNIGRVKQISCGGLHTAILLTNGQVYTCGYNFYGQLGRIGNETNDIPNPKFEIIDPNVGKVKQISCGYEHTAILLTNGLVYTCGYNVYGQLGRLGNGTNNNIPNPKFLKIDLNVGKVKQISCGGFHTAILLNNGLVYTCGLNVYGQLGRIGNGTNDIPNPKFEIIDKTIIKNIKFFLLSIGCTSESVLALPY